MKKLASSAHNPNYPTSAFPDAHPTPVQKCCVSITHVFTQNVTNLKHRDLVKLVIFTASSRTFLSKTGPLNCVLLMVKKTTVGTG